MYYYISNSIFYNPKFVSANPLLTNHFLETRMQFTLIRPLHTTHECLKFEMILAREEGVIVIAIASVLCCFVQDRAVCVYRLDAQSLIVGSIYEVILSVYVQARDD